MDWRGSNQPERTPGSNRSHPAHPFSTPPATPQLTNPLIPQLPSPSTTAICFADARGSQVEIVQNIGRALRLNRDGTTKVARIIVPVFLEAGEDPTDMVASASFRPLVADLVDADGVLPYIAPGVVFDGDDVGKWRWRQQEPGIWARLLPEQQARLTALGVQPAQAPAPAAGRGRRARVRHSRHSNGA